MCVRDHLDTLVGRDFHVNYFGLPQKLKMTALIDLNYVIQRAKSVAHV